MAKKWKRLHAMMAAANIPSFGSHDPVTLLANLMQVYESPPIRFTGNGRASVGGVNVNLSKFAAQALLSLESKSEIDADEYRIACERAALRRAKKEAKRAASRVERVARITYESGLVLGHASGQVFYSSPEWRRVRYRALEIHGGSCQACGASPRTGAVLHVDHIEPRSVRPERALDLENLQVLCEACNIGKGRHSSKDWRAS